MHSAFSKWQLCTRHEKDSELLKKNKHLQNRICRKTIIKLLNRKIGAALGSWKIYDTLLIRVQRQQKLCFKVVRKLKYSKLRQALEIWKSFVQEEIQILQSMELGTRRISKVVKKLLFSQLARSFSQWTHFNNFIAKSDLRELQARRLCKKFVQRICHFEISKAFRKWKLDLDRESSISKLCGMIFRRKVRYQLRDAFALWIHFDQKQKAIQRCLLKMSKRDIATVFRKWAKHIEINAKQTGLKRTLMHMENQIYSKLMIQAWHHWKTLDINHMHRNQKQELGMKFLQVRRNGARKVFAFSKWREHIQDFIMWSTKLAQRMFYHWKLFFIHSSNRRQVSVLHAVLSNQRFTVIKRVFSLLSFRLYAKYFQRWVTIDRRELIANRLFKRTIRRNVNHAFSFWKNAFQNSTMMMLRLHRVVQLFHNNCLGSIRISYIHWKHYAHGLNQQQHREKLLIKYSARIKRLGLVKCFETWQYTTRQVIQLRATLLKTNSRVEQLCQQFTSRNLKSCFQIWSDTVYCITTSRKLITRWIASKITKSIHRAWRRWLVFCQYQTSNKEMNSHIQSAQYQMNKIEKQLLDTREKSISKAIKRMMNIKLSNVLYQWSHQVALKRTINSLLSLSKHNAMRSRWMRWRHWSIHQRVLRLKRIMRSWNVYAVRQHAIRNFWEYQKQIRCKRVAFRNWLVSSELSRSLKSNLVCKVRTIKLRVAFDQLYRGGIQVAVNSLTMKVNVLTRMEARNRNKTKQLKEGNILRSVFNTWAHTASEYRSIRIFKSRHTEKAIERSFRWLSRNVRTRKTANKIFHFRKNALVLSCWDNWNKFISLEKLLKVAKHKEQVHKLKHVFAVWQVKCQRVSTLKKLLRTIKLYHNMAVSARSKFQSCFIRLKRNMIYSLKLENGLNKLQQMFSNRQKVAFDRWFERCNQTTLEFTNRRLSFMTKKCNSENIRARKLTAALEKLQKKTSAMQEKLDRLQCRNHPATPREILAEEQFYKQRELSGRPNPLPKKKRKNVPMKRSELDDSNFELLNSQLSCDIKNLSGRFNKIALASMGAKMISPEASRSFEHMLDKVANQIFNKESQADALRSLMESKAD